jgi:hypothetical protein
MRYVFHGLDWFWETVFRMTVLTIMLVAVWSNVESASLETAYVNIYHTGIGECGGRGGG